MILIKYSADFRFSKGWFLRFKKRHQISYRAPTNKAQQLPQHYIESIQKFHVYFRNLGKVSLTLYRLPTIGTPILGVFRLSDIANVDQTPCSFEFLDRKTYNIQGKKNIWVKSTSSGLDKRQMTIQLTIFADGIPRVKPIVVFRGKDLRITPTEKALWDSRVHVVFQDNACVNEDIFLWWIEHAWKLSCMSIFDKSQKLLVLDVHQAQKTELVKATFKNCRTSMAMVPPGCTSLVQPLDVSINKPFKQYLEEASEEHYYNNTTSWMEGKISAKERRILMSKWVVDAWDKICHQNKESIKRSFIKTGIAIPEDGSRNQEIYIEGVVDYQIPKLETTAEPGTTATEPETAAKPETAAEPKTTAEPKTAKLKTTEPQYIQWEGNGDFDEGDTSDSEAESCTSWYEDAERLGFGEYVHTQLSYKKQGEKSKYYTINIISE